MLGFSHFDKEGPKKVENLRFYAVLRVCQKENKKMEL